MLLLLPPCLCCLIALGLFRPTAAQGKHYGIPGVNVDGQDMIQMLKVGRAVTDYVRTQGPAILQVMEKLHECIHVNDVNIYYHLLWRI